MKDIIASASLNHLSFPSSDVTATADFFEKKLGCTVSSRGEHSVILKRPGFDIVITDAGIHAVAWHDDFHIGFEMPTVADVAALHEQFQLDGVAVNVPFFKHERGSRFFCTAPGGIVCEINTRADAEERYRHTFGN